MRKIDSSSNAKDLKLTDNEKRTLKTIQARQIIRSEDTMNIENFSIDVVDGMVPNLKRGALGLARHVAPTRAGTDVGLQESLGLPAKQKSIFSY